MFSNGSSTTFGGCYGEHSLVVQRKKDSTFFSVWEIIPFKREVTILATSFSEFLGIFLFLILAPDVSHTNPWWIQSNERGVTQENFYYIVHFMLMIGGIFIISLNYCFPKCMVWINDTERKVKIYLIFLLCFQLIL